MIRKLLLIAGPSFLIFGLEFVALGIHKAKIFTNEDIWGPGLDRIIIEGICRIVAFAALISVMGLYDNLVSKPEYAALKPTKSGYPHQPYNWK